MTWLRSLLRRPRLLRRPYGKSRLDGAIEVFLRERRRRETLETIHSAPAANSPFRCSLQEIIDTDYRDDLHKDAEPPAHATARIARWGGGYRDADAILALSTEINGHIAYAPDEIEALCIRHSKICQEDWACGWVPVADIEDWRDKMLSDFSCS